MVLAHHDFFRVAEVSLRFLRNFRNMRIQIIVVFVLGLFLSSTAWTQSKIVDSMINILNADTTSSPTKFIVAKKIGQAYKYRPKSLPYFKMMWHIARADGNIQNSAIASEFLGTYYYYNTNLDSSEFYYRQGLLLYQEIDNKSMMAKMYNNTGLALHRKGNYPAALNDYQNALQIFESLGDSVSISSTLNRIGGIYRDQQKPGLSLEYYDRALSIAQKQNSERFMIDALGNQGIVYQKMDSVQRAIECYTKALYLARKNQHQLRINTCLIALSSLYIKNGSIDSAEVFLEEAQLSESNRNRQTTIKINLGKIENTRENYRSAVSYLDDALKMANASGNKEHQKGALLSLIRAHYGLNQLEPVYRYFNAYDMIKDSLYQLSNIREVTRLEMQYNFDREQERLDAAQRQKDTRQRIFSFGLVGGLLALGCIALIIYRSARARKKMNVILEEKNQMIQKALEEKELLLREIHHRVKNNLQVISNLLYLQSEYNKDDSVTKALQEGQNRVRSMALIHKNLYQEDNLTGIEIKDYFEKLSVSLFKSYQVNREQIQLKTDIDPIRLDVDTIIPLALIVNELMSNSLEHAFTQQVSGEILVKLKEIDHQLVLTVSDNGPGLPAGFLPEDSDSFGFELVRLFSEKLEAKMEVKNDHGLTVDLVINKYQRA